MSYEDLISKNNFTWLGDMYLEAGNLQMANKVSFYEAALDGRLVVYRINRPGFLVDIHFFYNNHFFGPIVLVASNVDVGELDEAVNASLTTLCAKQGVSESMLKMKLELMGVG